MKAFKCLILILFCGCFSLPQKLCASAALLDSANVAYDQSEFSSALDQYERAYQAGYFTEKSLYRLAFMYEQMRQYPLAVFYLKKIAQTFGGRHINEKVVQLMQKNGSANYFTDDSETAWSLYMHRFGWIIWSLFLLSGLFLAAYALRFQFLSSGKTARLSAGISATLWGTTALILFVHFFFVSGRAVIVNPTAFYSGPAWASEWNPSTFSTGETVRVIQERDVWCKIRAGKKEAWVPGFVLRGLEN